MNKIKFLLSIISCISLLYTSNAQNYVDLARFHYATTPQNNFDSIKGSTNIEEFGADITLPIVLNDNNTFLTGFYLEQIKMKLHPDLNLTTISTVNLKVGFNRKHSDKWSGTYMILPKLSSDFENISNKDLQVGVLALMKYNKSENFKYNIGMYYNNELFGPFLVPLLGFYYKSSNDKFEANFTLPIWADMNYKLANWLNFGTSFSAFVRSYYLGNDQAYIVKKTNEVFGYLQFNVKKNFLIQTKVGYSLGRSYRVYEEDDKVDLGFSAFRFGDNRSILNSDFNDGIIFRARLIYRFHLK